MLLPRDKTGGFRTRGRLMKMGVADDSQVLDYAIHKAGVLGGKYSANPYKVGYLLFQYVEDCWDKGRVPGTVHQGKGEDL